MPTQLLPATPVHTRQNHSTLSHFVSEEEFALLLCSYPHHSLYSGFSLPRKAASVPGADSGSYQAVTPPESSSLSFSRPCSSGSVLPRGIWQKTSGDVLSVSLTGKTPSGKVSLCVTQAPVHPRDQSRLCQTPSKAELSFPGFPAGKLLPYIRILFSLAVSY